MRRDAAADAAAAAAAAGANYTGGEGGIAGNGTDFGFSEEQMEVGIKHNTSFFSSPSPFFWMGGGCWQRQTFFFLSTVRTLGFSCLVWGVKTN